jgi:hypothetical protein
MSPSPIKPDNYIEPVEPISYWQLQLNRDGLPEAGEEKPAPIMPKLPPESPWAAEQLPEPTIDRSREDGDFINMTED